MAEHKWLFVNLSDTTYETWWCVTCGTLRHDQPEGFRYARPGVDLTGAESNTAAVYARGWVRFEPACPPQADE